jgi:hypothetical protein
MYNQEKGWVSMDIDFLSSVPQTDPGSEGGIGFDYQWHMTCYLCTAMLLNPNILRVVCEYGEDITLHRKDSAIEKFQVKKRDSGSWTLSELIKPVKKQTKGILSKLFEPIQEGKKVAKIGILGCGKLGNIQISECSLPGLIALLDIPLEERDENWKKALRPYVEYLSNSLSSQGISANTVKSAIEILVFNFSLPNPESIETKNKECLAKAIRRVWEIDVTHDQAAKIYFAIYMLAKKANTSARRPWREKSIERQDIVRIVMENLEYPYPTVKQSHSLSLQDKLSRVNLGDRHKYSLDARTEAIGLKYEKDLLASTWEKFGVEIHMKWQDHRKSHPSMTGLTLWKALLEILESIGDNWSNEYKDPRLGARFAEGVFFDMAGICIVDFKRDSYE